MDPETQLWKMTQPIAARADLFVVNSLIQMLRTARVEGFVTDDPTAAFEPFGLDAPSSSLVLGRAGAPVFGIKFGRNSTNQPEQVFAQLQSRSNIVVVAAGLLDMLRRPHTTYRDHSLVTVSPAAVDRVEIRTRERVVLERDPGKPWRIVEPFAAAADPEAVRSLFESVNRLRIVEFTKDIVDNFAPYGLDTPDRQYSFFSRGNSQVSTNTLLARIDFSGNQIAGSRVDTVFARCEGESSVYTVPYGDTLQLPRAAYELRDKQLWSFDTADVVRCIVEHGGTTNVWDRTDEGVWTGDLVLNASMEEVMHRVGNLRVVSWKAKGRGSLALYGVGAASARMILELKNGETPRVLEFGRESGRGPYVAVTLEDVEPVIFVFPNELAAFLKRDFFPSVKPE